MLHPSLPPDFFHQKIPIKHNIHTGKQNYVVGRCEVGFYDQKWFLKSKFEE